MVKDHNNGTGRGRKFFSELDKILGCRPASIPSVVLESCSTPDPQYVEDGDRNANGKIYTSRVLAQLILDQLHDVFLPPPQIKLTYTCNYLIVEQLLRLQS